LRAVDVDRVQIAVRTHKHISIILLCLGKTSLQQISRLDEHISENADEKLLKELEVIVLVTIQLALPPSVFSRQLVGLRFLVVNFFSTAGDDEGWRASEGAIFEPIQLQGVFLEYVLFEFKAVEFFDFVFLMDFFLKVFEFSRCEGVSLGDDWDNVDDGLKFLHDDPLALVDPGPRDEEDAAVDPRIWRVTVSIFPVFAV
jgi:hypothetical protein